MRTFIAIEIPKDVKEQMAEVQRRLKDTGVDASWPRPEGMHLTLKFLGEIPESQVADIKTALITAVGSMNRFRLKIKGAGAFPNPKSARVVWIGVSGDLENLVTLQTAVEEALVRLGMEPDDRPFKPHITLGRIKYIRSKQSWLGALEQEKDIEIPGFDVTAVSLMKSELRPTGAEYTEVVRIELK